MKRHLPDPFLKDYNSWSNVPRDQRKAKAWVAKSIAKVFGITLGPVGLFFVDVLFFVASTAVTTAVISAVQRGKFNAELETSQGRLVNARAPTAPQQFVYGQVRKGGTIVNLKTTGASNKYLHMIIALAGHEVHEIGDIYVNDSVVTIDGDGLVTSDPWNSKILVTKHDASSSDTGCDWPDGLDKPTGIAYLYIRLEYDQNVFAGGIPNFTAVVSGKKVYDPRDSGQSASDGSTWTYSSNSALCIADYLRADYGLGDDSYARIDDTMLQAAANVCDESVTLSGGGTENRYECHGVLDASNTPADNLGRLLTSCNGTLFWGSGKWKVLASAYTSPVKDFTLDDLRSEINLQTRNSTRDNFNMVQGTFVDATQDWISVDYPTIKSTGDFLFEDNGVENALDLDLPFTTSASMAQRLAKLMLFTNREQMALTAEFGTRAFDLEVGDIIRLTIDRYGWTNKEFLVMQWGLTTQSDTGDLRVQLSLKEISQAAFSWTAEETAIIANNTTLPKFDDPITFNITPSLQVNSFAEQLRRDLIIDVTAKDIGRIESLEIQIARANDTLGILDVTGLINKDKVIRAIEANAPEFVTDTIFNNPSGRKVADFDNDGDVDATDKNIYLQYYFQDADFDNDNDVDSLDEAKLARIEEAHEHMLVNSRRYSEYLLASAFPSGEAVYRTVWQGKPPKAIIPDVAIGRFNIRARAISRLGFLTDWVTFPAYEIPFSDQDIAPAFDGFVSCNDIQSVDLYWGPSNSPSLSHYEVRHSTLVHGEEVTTGSFVAGNHYEITNVGDTDFTEIGAASNTVGVEFWCHSDSTTYTANAVGGGTTGKAKNVVKIDKTISWIDNVARPANSVTTAPKAGTYVVRAFSKAGTPSVDYLRIPLTASEFDNPFSSSSTTNVWNTDQEYDDVTIQSALGYYPTGSYALTTVADFQMTQTWTAHNTIDIGSVQKARCYIDHKFIKLNVDNKLGTTLDETYGPIDNLSVNFDDLDYEIIADFSLIGFVRVSDDNSTYSEWQRLTANIVKGRYFQFKIEIKSQNQTGPVFNDVQSVTNPSSGTSRITTNGLVAKVEY